MKAISLWQPWATLWVLGVKIHETRHWPTDIRAAVAVHAAKRWTRDQAELLEREPFRSALAPYVYPPISGRPPLPLGAFVGIVNVTDCVPVEKVETTTELDFAFGDFSPGRFAWRGSEFWRFDPIPARGRQGFFDVAPQHFEKMRATARRVR